MAKAFKRLDLDKNGILSRDELRKAFEGGSATRRTEEFWKLFLKSIDADGDGRITLDEFIDFMEINHRDIDQSYAKSMLEEEDQ
jgi:Ca2+-binding EF-hand superfamily protein